MSDPFVHLRVASGYSLQYGASHPSALVARAADHGMDTLALTDRDGMYGAVRFAKACLKSGIAPVVGVDLAMPIEQDEWRPQPARGKAVRGGELRDPRLPRVVALAESRAGWASLCRLTSATHLGGERGSPIGSRASIGEHGRDVRVMLGADSELGWALARERPDIAEQVLRRWREVCDPEQLVIAVTDQQVAGTGVGSQSLAARMIAFADRHRLATVLTNAVRMADRHLAPTIDVLDAARRLVPLDRRNVDRRNAEGYLKPGKEMLELAHGIAHRAGRGRLGAEQLLADTRRLALACRLDPRADIGLGEVHLPEFEVLERTGSSRGVDAFAALRERCESGMYDRYGSPSRQVRERLEEELDVIAQMGYAAYFLTVADVVGMVKGLGIRCAARGSGAGSLVNYVLGISGVEPLRYGLIMERFLSPLRMALPDIDLDVESARRTEIYEHILTTFGGERVACVAMLDTYRVRHAVRDVGAALSMPPSEIDAIATAFPHIRARDARAALRDLPELRAAGLADRRLDVLFSLVESLDGLPRHIALHPCGVLLSDATLLDRTPVEASFGGFPMSQFDKDDVEDIGLLKLDVLGIRMQSAMSHALDEIVRVSGEHVDIDHLDPYDDPDTYGLIASTHTLGCFQIESPGQRELVGKFGPETFNDIIIDISLFRPGPVKSDMVVPFLNARQGWKEAVYPHPDLQPVLAETGGVVVFHEQIIKIVSVMTGCTLAQGDEARRALGDPVGQIDVKAWFVPTCRERGYSEAVIRQVWFVLESFASFGFCKAHAAAFALPTYQSAWLKTHYPAFFIAGLLTHDPGMYPKRLILEEARRMGVTVHGLDVNASDASYRVERTAEGAHAIRLSIADVKGISEQEVARVVAARPYSSLSDFWTRAQVTAPVVERLVLAGGFDALYGIGPAATVRRKDRLTRRDLLLSVADLQRSDRADAREAARARGLRRLPPQRSGTVGDDPRERARAQAVALPTAAERARPLQIQTALPLDDARGVGAFPLDDAAPQVPLATDVTSTGLPDLSDDERLSAELEILGLDASRHVIERYLPFLRALGVTFSDQLRSRRNQSEVFVAGVKVATQTPPIRSGRRVIFLTLDDSTGPVDATFFEDAQGPYAATVFHSWLMVVRGEIRRTGPRGLSLTASGAWELDTLYAAWTDVLDCGGSQAEALAAVQRIIDTVPEGFGYVGEVLDEGTPDAHGAPLADTQQHGRGGGMGRRRVLVHPSGFTQSPYADVKPAGPSTTSAPRKLWHSSPGSSGR